MGVGPLLRRAAGSRPRGGSGKPGRHAAEAVNSMGDNEHGVREL